MTEYIKKEYAYFAAVLIASLSADHKITCDEVQKIMNCIPNADVVERKKGKRHGRLIEEPKQLSYGGLAYISPNDVVGTAKYFLDQYVGGSNASN